ncbi:MAG: AAA family ATPase [Candidatus Aenigmarchaeota archaeon]|nr:AAA family ATPase [Candidatus Aenigmarchaeota archaeon]
MRIVFIGGSKDSSKDAIVNQVVRAKSALPEYEYMKLSDAVHVDVKHVWKSRQEQMKLRHGIQAAVKKRLEELAEKETRNVIINGYFTIDTKHGFFPLLSEDLLRSLHPDAILVIEEDIGNPHMKLPDDMEKFRRMLAQQEVNIHYAGLYSYLTGANINVIRVRKGHVKRALLETITAIRNVFSD